MIHHFLICLARPAMPIWAYTSMAQFGRNERKSKPLHGLGVGYLSHLGTGVLVRVLEPWCQPYPGFFLYYPSRRQQSPALSALINLLRVS